MPMACFCGIFIAIAIAIVSPKGPNCGKQKEGSIKKHHFKEFLHCIPPFFLAPQSEDLGKVIYLGQVILSVMQCQDTHFIGEVGNGCSVANKTMNAKIISWKFFSILQTSLICISSFVRY